MRMCKLSWISALAAAAVACGGQAAGGDAAGTSGPEDAGATDPTEVRRALAEVDARWEQAANRGDAEAVAALYEEGGLLLPPNADISEGRDAIRGVIQGYIDAGMKNMDFTALEVGTDGDLAYEVGLYTYDLQPPGREDVITDRGKYVIVARRQPDGGWMLVADIFNSSLPAR